MSSFLFRHPRVAVKRPWLDDGKCHQKTPTDGDRGAVTLLNQILVWERFAFSFAAYVLDIVGSFFFFLKDSLLLLTTSSKTVETCRNKYQNLKVCPVEEWRLPRGAKDYSSDQSLRLNQNKPNLKFRMTLKISLQVSTLPLLFSFLPA